MSVAVLFDKKYVFFGGKGGTGKQLCRRFFFEAPERGKRIYWFPPIQLTLCQTSDKAIGPKGAQILDNLFALRWIRNRGEEYIEGIKRQLSSAVSSVVIDALQKKSTQPTCHLVRGGGNI